jgi:hypothetical protein
LHILTSKWKEPTTTEDLRQEATIMAATTRATIRGTTEATETIEAITRTGMAKIPEVVAEEVAEETIEEEEVATEVVTVTEEATTNTTEVKVVATTKEATMTIEVEDTSNAVAVSEVDVEATVETDLASARSPLHLYLPSR